MKKQLAKLALTATLGLAFIFTTSCGEHSWEEEGYSSSSFALSSSSLQQSVDSHPGAIVEPLLKTKWNQGSPYNDLFPIVDGVRKVTDCGTTAMVQIIAFHKYPPRGMGRSSAVGPGSIPVPLTSLNVAYDWDNMLNEYTRANPGNEQQRSAVATLMYHFGLVREQPSILSAMVNNFGYDKDIKYLYRKNYSDAEWEAIIRQQLDLGLPVFYHGKSVANDDDENFSVNSSHGFVVDGYDNAGKFHINPGWSGSYDGWYSLNDINLGNGRRYNYDNVIYINIKPDTSLVFTRNIVSDTITDSRDGKKYVTVKIGEQTWMAENLNYEASDSKCYENKTENCDRYGRLYNWAAAMEACPSGWHLPSNAEWDKLLRYVDGTNGTASPYNSETAGIYLKDNGTDNYGFSALMGGSYSGSSFSYVGSGGYWWSSSENGSNNAYGRYMNYSGGVKYSNYSKRFLYNSVRCIQN